jgi:hypothetical protein
MAEYGFKLINELFKLFLSQLKLAVLLIANNGKANQYILWNNLDISLNFKGVKVLPEF